MRNTGALYVYYVTVRFEDNGKQVFKVVSSNKVNAFRQLASKLKRNDITSITFPCEVIPLSEANKQAAINRKKAAEKRRKKEYEERVSWYSGRELLDRKD